MGTKISAAFVANPRTTFDGTEQIPLNDGTSNAAAGLASALAVYVKGTLGTAAPLNVDTDDTLAANSDSNVASQKATKTYVDAKVAGLSWKQEVRAGTTANGTLSSAYANGQTIDGVTLATGDRILVKNQTSGAENGIYTVNASGAPTRATDADSSAELVDATVMVSEGSTLADTQWTCTTNAPITVGTTSLAFAQFSAGGSATITVSGGVETVSGSAITTGADTIRLSLLPNAQTGTTYALIASDRGKHVTLSNAASIAVSIAQAGGTGFESGYATAVDNIGAGAATITPTTSTINGASTLVLDSGVAALLFSDGTNYRAIVIERAGVLVNAQTGTTYAVLSGDRGKLITTTNVGAIAVSLAQATGAFGAGWFAWLQNRGAGTATYTPSTSTIDGASTLALTTGQGCLIASDGTNYFTSRGMASGGALTNFTEAANSSSPNVTVPAVSLTATNAATTVDVVLSPKGGGSLLAQIPDGTSTGGAKRGTNAVDWQSSRSSSAQVATGVGSTIGGGALNQALGDHGHVGGGYNNTISTSGVRHTICGGDGNSITGGSRAFIGGGGTNSITAGAYGAIGCGLSNTSSGNYTAIVGGRSNTAPADYASVTGGFSNTADGTYSRAGGNGAIARGIIGVDVWSSAYRAAVGDNQWMKALLVGATTDGATGVVLSTDRGAAATTNQITIPTSYVTKVQGQVVGRSNTNTDCVAFEFSGLFKNVGGTVSAVGTPTCTQTASDSGMTGATCVLSADNTNKCPRLTVVGIASTTVYWAAEIRAVQVK